MLNILLSSFRLIVIFLMTKYVRLVILLKCFMVGGGPSRWESTPHKNIIEDQVPPLKNITGH